LGLLIQLSMPRPRRYVICVDVEPSPEPTLDLLMILIAELQRDGVLDGRNITSMVRRLELSDLSDLAQRVQMIPLSNALDEPDDIRSGFEVIDGGKRED